jgi:hypothetical protein
MRQPCERNLCGCRVLPLGDASEQVDQCPVCLPGLRRKAGHGIAEVSAVERGVLVHLSREITLAQRAERDETDAEFFKRRNDFRFRFSPPKRVLALKCRDRLDRMSAPNDLHARFRKSEMLDLAFLDKVLHRSGYLFNRHDGIDAMLVEKINAVGVEPLRGKRPWRTLRRWSWSRRSSIGRHSRTITWAARK